MEPRYIELFLRKIDRSGGPGACWPWTGSKKDGYGRAGVGGDKYRRANIVALELKLGRPLLPGMLACHTCDNRACCNDEHLYEGTHAQNMADMWARGRSGIEKRSGDRHGRRLHPETTPRGEGHHEGKLSDEKVRGIRQAHEDGVTPAELSKHFNVDRTMIGRVVRRQAWNHVGSAP